MANRKLKGREGHRDGRVLLRPGGHDRLLDGKASGSSTSASQINKMNRTNLTKRMKVIREKDGLRGEVPSYLEGRRDRVFATYLDTLNPRANEIMQLALSSSPDVRFQAFLERVMTPRFLRVSLATIAKGCGISLLEFQEWWRKASTQRAIAQAQIASPELVTDLIADSRTREDVCDRCDGLGTLIAPPNLDPDQVPGYRLIKEATLDMDAIYHRTCPRCAGIGKIRRSGDSHARDRLLEMAGLKGSRNAASVVVNFGGASLSSAVTLLDDAMSIDPSPVVDSRAEDPD